MQITCKAFDVADGSFLQAVFNKEMKKRESGKYYFMKHHQNLP